MKVSQAAEKLTMELGMFVNLSRIDKYEERGIITAPRANGRYKEYSDEDVDRLRKVVVLSELGIPLMEIRKLILGIDVQLVVEDIKARIAEVKRFINIAEQFLGLQSVIPTVKPNVGSAPQQRSGIVYK